MKESAVMNVEAGETIVGTWVSPAIAEIGVYKLIAKEKTSGACEWAHFVQRDDGRKEKVYRGEVESRERLADVVQAINRTLQKIYGIQLGEAAVEARRIDGPESGYTVH